METTYLYLLEKEFLLWVFLGETTIFKQSSANDSPYFGLINLLRYKLIIIAATLCVCILLHVLLSVILVVSSECVNSI